MISETLRFKFKILETAAFPVWQKAKPEERERICRELGTWEGEQIIKEINEEAKICFSKS
jgi:hypothetical protein